MRDISSIANATHQKNEEVAADWLWNWDQRLPLARMTLAKYWRNLCCSGKCVMKSLWYITASTVSVQQSSPDAIVHRISSFASFLFVLQVFEQRVLFRNLLNVRFPIINLFTNVRKEFAREHEEILSLVVCEILSAVLKTVVNYWGSELERQKKTTLYWSFGENVTKAKTAWSVVIFLLGLNSMIKRVINRCDDFIEQSSVYSPNENVCDTD